MYTNSEPHGSNELPDSMLSQVNLSQTSHTNNNALNVNMLGKQGRVASQTNNEQFNAQTYSEFGQVPMSFEPPSSPCSPPQSDGSDDGVPRTMHAGLNFVAVDVPKFKIDTEHEENESIHENYVEVKLEPASWADTDYQQPFCRDSNGVMNHDRIHGQVVYSEASVERAREYIRNGNKSAVYLECPSCALVLRHPKRFLVHVQWHSFGLTNARRRDELREQQSAKDEKRRARYMERLKIEEAREAPDGQYPCKDCDKVFLARGGLKKHRAKHHPIQMTSCKVCLAPVRGLAGFRAHMATHTSKERETQRYQCPECPKKYKFSHSLYKHIDTHLEKTHKCEVCTKMFGSSAQLGRHMKSHEKIARGAQFHCAFCGKGYYDTFTLQIHERTHTNERPFTCDICNTAFQTNSSLKRHTRISHNSAAPHRCTTCQRAFNSERVLERHVLRAHSDPDNFQYPCAMCDKRLTLATVTIEEDRKESANYNKYIARHPPFCSLARDRPAEESKQSSIEEIVSTKSGSIPSPNTEFWRFYNRNPLLLSPFWARKDWI